MTPVIFLGAGPGAADLITLRGRRALEEAGAVLYAGSLVNPDILSCCSRDCLLKDSAGLDLESQVAFMMEARAKGLSVVRLHSGDPSLYGAVREQMRELEKRGVPYEVIPGVTCAFAAAAALRTELTMPGEAQSVVITRCPGRTPLARGAGTCRLRGDGRHPGLLSERRTLRGAHSRAHGKGGPFPRHARRGCGAGQLA